ncbi:hypothetical protein E5K00_12970 [Hymenobacter aquaticus]|uniref:Uncharacterized protein n=1 Tax=Hymenobacter aquaticus TaxID=1867101 RepID=A0A4Z0PWD7_9BACT|nr:hypothetical protein [Hymenobacter aquaticus]TGE21203.1 hypothetical protein E5K00_12970 [Hymenobacter aquaticus]
MSRALGGRLCVVYLVGPALMQTILSGPDFQPSSAYDDKPFIVAFFGDEGAAIGWLQLQQ